MGATECNPHLEFKLLIAIFSKETSETRCNNLVYFNYLLDVFNSSPSSVYCSSPNVLLTFPSSGQKRGSQSSLTNELCFCFPAKVSQQNAVLPSTRTQPERAQDFRSSENSTTLSAMVPHLLKRSLLVNSAIWHAAIKSDRNLEVLGRSKYLLQSPGTFRCGISGNSPEASFLGIKNKKSLKTTQKTWQPIIAKQPGNNGKKQITMPLCFLVLQNSIWHLLCNKGWMPPVSSQSVRHVRILWWAGTPGSFTGAGRAGASGPTSSEIMDLDGQEELVRFGVEMQLIYSRPSSAADTFPWV